MHTLLLRLAGPMQSWGTQSRFTERDTGLEPSKSGVIGLICAAMGRDRWAPVDDLARLRCGVRVDREGVMRADYQTAMNVVKADTSRPKQDEAVVSTRYYLADADFLVGLEGEDTALLSEIEAALRAPRLQLFLGRKAFVPSRPVYLRNGGLREGTMLAEALKGEPWRPRTGDPERWESPASLRAVLEAEPADGSERRADQPVGASFASRRFLPRYVMAISWTVGEPPADIAIEEPEDA
jgi:CRISPR system Cascade subunit CasD